MRLLLISANTELVNMRTLPWGLWCVATAARRAGHDVATLDLMEAADPEAAVTRALRQHEPQLIGMSVRNVDDQRMESQTFFLPKVRSIVEACRAASEAPIVLGGAGYSIFPEATLEYLGADFGIQGEGEAALPALAATLDRGEPLENVPGLFVRGRGALTPRSFLPRLDVTAPFPDDECLSELPPDDPNPGNPLWVPLQIRRGCPFDCAYCSAPAIEGRKVRGRSAAAVVEWLASHPAVAARPLYVVDNNFNVPRRAAIKLCRAIVESGLRLHWRCILNARSPDEELLSLMARAGCQEVALGFEAGSTPMLRSLAKPLELGDIQRSAELLRAVGIRSMGFLLLGGPGETRETVMESLCFADRIPLDAVRITAGIRIYPGTPLSRQAIADGHISPEDNLLEPRFYLARGLESWLVEYLKEWCAGRPNWLF